MNREYKQVIVDVAELTEIEICFPNGSYFTMSNDVDNPNSMFIDVKHRVIAIEEPMMFKG